MKPPTPAEIGNYGQEIGLPFEECEAFYDHFESNGWKVGGRTAMKSWQAAMRKWKRNWMSGIFRKWPKDELSGADKMILQKELERCLDRISMINGQYGPMQTWARDDKEKIRILRERAAEIRQKLGIKL